MSGLRVSPFPSFSGLERRKKTSRTELKPREVAVLSFRQSRSREKEAFAINPRLRCAIGWWTSQAKQLKKKRRRKIKANEIQLPLSWKRRRVCFDPSSPFVLFISAKHLLLVRTPKNRKSFCKGGGGKGVEMPSFISLPPLERKQGTQLKQI